MTKTPALIDGETRGCVYNSSGTAPDVHAYAYSNMPPFYANATDDKPAV